MIAMQLSLERYGVVPLVRCQGGTALSSNASRSWTQPTGGSVTLPTRGEQSKATGHHKLTTMQWNAEGVQKKKIVLQKFLKDNDVSICCIQETHLNPNLRFSIRGYTSYRNDRLGRHKGGVLTLVRNCLPSVETHRSNSNAETETIIVSVILPDKVLTVLNIYSPSNRISLPTLEPDQDNFLALGDFNSHSPSWGYRNLDAKGEEVEQWMTENQLVLINKPDDTDSYYSRTWRTTSTPDLAIATDDLHKISQREVCKQLGGSDHKPILISLEKCGSRQGKLPPSWNYKKADWHQFSLLSDEYTSKVDSKQVDLSAKEWTSGVLKAAQESIPNGRRRDYKPFWNDDLEDLHNKLSNAREEMEKSPSDSNTAKHTLARAAFDDLKTILAKSSWEEKTEGLNFHNNSRKLWELTGALNEDNCQHGKTTLKAGDKQVSGKEAGNVLAKQFEADSTIQVNQDRVREVRRETTLIREEQQDPAPSCMTDPFYMRELNVALQKLKNKKAPGADGITNEMLKHLGPSTKRVLLQIYNLSWHSGKFPTKWKEAHIKACLKKGKDKSQPESYRPISLLSCTGKLLERLINKRLLWHLESNNLLSPTQTGYRQHRSTEDQLAYLTQDIQDGFSDKKKSLAVFFDLSKAFDTVWKEGLLLKLLRSGVQGKMYKWIKNYLFQRSARVKLDGTLSNLVKIREGVPQGGVISPILFLIYMNDIVDVLPRQVSNTIHADDFSVWSKEERTPTAIHRIQEAVTSVNMWTKRWALNLNRSKTVSMHFTLGHKETINLSIQDHPIPQVETTKFLGVILDTRLTWAAHIDATEAKALKSLSIMRKLAGTKWGANSKILKQVYAGLVRPITEYASTTWMTASNSHKDKLDKVQNAGLRIILGAMKSTPISEMEKTADIEPLERRRQYKTLTLAEKAKRLPSHPIHEKLKAKTKNRLKRKTLNHHVKELQTPRKDMLGDQVEPLQPDPWIPKQGSIVFNCKVPGIESKGKLPPQEMKVLTLEMIRTKFPSHSWIHSYTDGSADQAVQNGGCGIYTIYPDKSSSSVSIPAGKNCTNYKAEVLALSTAAHNLGELQGKNIVFLTDCLSTIEDLESGPTDTPSKELLEKLLHLALRNNVVIQWIPAHIGLKGNDKADSLAKQGSRMQQEETPTTYREVKTMLKNEFRQDWRRKYDYIPERDDLHRLDRRSQTSIFRLRTGHCGLRKHMAKMGLADSAACPCGATQQTVEHFLQMCPHLDQLREETWSTPTTVQDKLYGDEPSLHRTMHFITTSGQHI